MSGNDINRLSTGEQRARAAVRGLPVPAADGAFRARLKAQFVDGSIREAIEWPEVAAGRFANARLVAGALAMAAILAFLAFGLNRYPAPRAIGGNGYGHVSIDGVEFPSTDLTGIDASLSEGSRVALSGGATLDIHYPGTMGWRIFSGTTVTLPERPGRWFGREIASHMEYGEISVRTGDHFGGTSLTLATDEGLALVTGTLVSVVRDSSVTCVCVHEGSVRMEAAGVDLGVIPVGKRRVLFRDGSDPVILDIAAPHRDHLIELDADY